jgi:hypothetical protein
MSKVIVFDNAQQYATYAGLRRMRLDEALQPWQLSIKPGDVTVMHQDIFGEIVPTFFVVLPSRPGNEDELPTPKNYLECRVFTKFCVQGESTMQHRAVMQGKLDCPDDLEMAREDGFQGKVFVGCHDRHWSPLMFYGPSKVTR